VYNEDRSVFVILNGEIYNYRELRSGLERRGHVFTTNTDTEVLVHLYEDHGIEMIQQLNGMFAFLIADLHKREFHIVRDRLGIKPIYYLDSGDRIVFASELRSMHMSGFDIGELSPQALANYFTYLCIPSPETPFRRLRKLEAGHRLEITEKGVLKVRWWQLKDHLSPKVRSFQAATEELKALLQDAVRLQLRSDVPVGTCLSGGVDSSLVTALSAEVHSGRLDTFFAIFEPAEFDERPFAQMVSQRFGTRHHEVRVTVEEAIQHLPELAWMLDEPNGDAAALPTFLISKLAAQHVKVCLSGLGGDELFGGYSRYRKTAGRIGRLANLPRPLLTNVLRPVLSAIGPQKQIELNWWLSHPEPWQAYFRVLRQSTPEFLELLFPGSAMEQCVGHPAEKLYKDCLALVEPNRRMFVDAQLYMNDQLLQLTDRMSMACSLEMRVPILDHRVVEFSMALPAHWKTRGEAQKRLIRSGFEGLIPSEVFDRPKYGFGPPHERWVSQPAFRLLMEQTARGKLVADGFLDRTGVEQVLLAKESQNASAGFVWMLVCLELWYRGISDRCVPSREAMIA
jgi:asparagine synthase (glutamine-hydrolysing)